MKTVFDLPFKPSDASALTAEQLRLLLAKKEAELAAMAAQKEAELNQIIEHKENVISQRDNRIRLLEELLRLAQIQRFAAKSEKLPFQID